MTRRSVSMLIHEKDDPLYELILLINVILPKKAIMKGEFKYPTTNFPTIQTSKKFKKFEKLKKLKKLN